MDNTPIILLVIHLCYYIYFQLISDFMRMGSRINTPHIEITRLINKHKVNIQTFQKLTNHLGFAWFKTLYLNEKLFNKKFKSSGYKQLQWAFHHEHYHIIKRHKLKTLLLRLVFTCTLFLLYYHWIAFVVFYIGFALIIHFTERMFERYANRHANEIVKI